MTFSDLQICSYPTLPFAWASHCFQSRHFLFCSCLKKFEPWDTFLKASLHHGYNIYHFDIFIFSVLCLENSACSHWTFISNYNNYFNCTLTSSCEERKMFLYPSKTTSGNRICQPDLSEERRRRCNACNTFTPFCHGRCYFQRICLFAACSRSPFREDSGDTCSQIAMEAAEEDCHSDCSNMDQDSENAQKCHDCIEEHFVRSTKKG